MTTVVSKSPGQARRLRLLCLVALPPPITGRTIATRRFLNRLKEDADLIVADLNAGMAGTKANRTGKLLRSALWVARMAFGAPRKVDFVYIVANHGAGLWVDIVFALLARLWGVPVIVHHHVFSYFNRRSWKLAVLFRLTSESGRHLLLCESMRRSAERMYTTSATLSVMPNFGSEERSEDSDGRRSRRCLPMEILFLSNLTMEKGVDTVLRLARQFAAREDVVFHLAGPAMSPKVQHAIECALESCGDGLVWHGPVNAEERSRLLVDADLFVFPTRYCNEAQPLVLIEALEAGVPVIANGRGCIPEMLAVEFEGFAVDDSLFIERASQTIDRMLSDAGYRVELSDRALRCADRLQERSRHCLQTLVSELACRPATD